MVVPTTRRHFLRVAALGPLGAALLSACSQTAPTAAPKPTEAAKPAESKPAEAAKPATAAPPAAAPAAPAASPATAAPAASPAAAAPAASPAVAAPAASIKTAGAVVSTNLYQAPWFAGVDKGIFLKHGVDLKIKQLEGGAASTAALMSGEAAITLSAIPNFATSIEQGIPMVMVGVVFGDATKKYADDSLAIVARNDRGINSVKDLAGKKIGLQTSGTPDLYLQEVLNKNGVPVDQVERFNVLFVNQVQALASGQVDALSTGEAQVTQALEQVPNTHLVIRGGGFLSYFNLLVTRQPLIESDPDLVQRLVDGWAATTQFVRKNQDEAADISLKWLAGLESPIARKAIRFLSFDPRAPQVLHEVFDETNKLLLDQKKIKAPVDFPKNVNMSFMNKTLQAHPELFDDLKPVELWK